MKDYQQKVVGFYTQSINGVIVKLVMHSLPVNNTVNSAEVFLMVDGTSGTEIKSINPKNFSLKGFNMFFPDFDLTMDCIKDAEELLPNIKFCLSEYTNIDIPESYTI